MVNPASVKARPITGITNFFIFINRNECWIYESFIRSNIQFFISCKNFFMKILIYFYSVILNKIFTGFKITVNYQLCCNIN